MKYKLLKDLPLAKAGMEVRIEWNSCTTSMIHSDKHYSLWTILNTDIPEWLEEVKEPKTIYDLKFWDHYWTLSNRNNFSHDHCWMSQSFFETDVFCTFVTEREAKRNKLLRELATRTSKHLPKKWENYICSTWISRIWQDLDYQILDYNIGLVFYGDDDYNSFMTDENKKLLFEI